MSWPPSLANLQADLGFVDQLDAEVLQDQLDAAVAFVERVHAGSFDFGDESPESELPEPDADMFLGTLRLAGRWYTRRRSPEGLIEMVAMGSGRVPSFDPDIDRMLRIGKYVPARFA